MTHPPNNAHKSVFVADVQILGAAFFFGIGFLGQRAISVDGLGPMTVNAFRFGLSTILLAMCLPMLPSDAPIHDEKASDGEEETDDEEHEYMIKHSSNGNNDEESSTINGNKNKTPKAICNAYSGASKSKNSTTSYVIRKLFGSYWKTIRFAKKTVWFWGLTLGLLNFLGSGFQQWGITMTSASKVAFIAGFDLFLTPIFGLFIPTFKAHANVQLSTWLAVFVSLIGLFLLSGANLNDFEMGMGETLTLISTVFWTMHITYTDIATTYVDTMSMMCIQMGFVSFLSACLALYLEPHQWFFNHQWLYYYWPWIIYLAITEGLGFTLMATGQNTAPPTHAAIILSLEGVFAAVASYVFLGEHLSHRETLGCVLMLISTLAAEVGCPMIDNLWEKKGDHSGGMIAEGSIVGDKHNTSQQINNIYTELNTNLHMIEMESGGKVATYEYDHTNKSNGHGHNHGHAGVSHLRSVSPINTNISLSASSSSSSNSPDIRHSYSKEKKLVRHNPWVSWYHSWMGAINPAAAGGSPGGN